jgi:hypothetical protein
MWSASARCRAVMAPNPLEAPVMMMVLGMAGPSV